MLYLRLKQASPTNWYWSQPAQNWTSDHTAASMFDKREDAEHEARRAEYQGAKGEIEICERKQ